MAYENMTYEVILNRMLDRITSTNPNIDIRQGSMIFDAIAPEALELAMAYVELDNSRNESFVPTATRDGKLRGCIDVGIDTSIFEATYGTFKAEFNIEVEIGSRWNLDLYNYQVIEYISKNESNYYEYIVRCETLGTAPNGVFGELTPIENIPTGLTHAELTEVLIEGENETSDDDITLFYLNHVNGMATDGNVEQYKVWCTEYSGIGRHKIFSLWNGKNTVKVSILSASNGIATDELIKEFQKYLDPCDIKLFEGDGSTTEFSMMLSATDYPPVIDMVRIDKVVKQPNVDYTYTNGKLTFTSAPADESEIEIRYNGGMGNGVAPIGAFVTVTTATEKTINVSASVSFTEGYTDTSVLDDAVEQYFNEIAYEKTRVSYMGLGAAIINVPAVNFITDLTLNDGSEDIILGDEEIPILGTTNWTVAET